MRYQEAVGHNLFGATAGRLPRKAHRGSAHQVALADLDRMRTRGQIYTAAVVILGDFAGIVYHRSPVDLEPPRVVHIDCEMVEAGRGRENPAGPYDEGRIRQRTQLFDAGER